MFIELKELKSKGEKSIIINTDLILKIRESYDNSNYTDIHIKGEKTLKTFDNTYEELKSKLIEVKKFLQ